MFLSALSVLSEGRGEPGELGFSALEKYRRESRFCPGFGIIWPRFSSGPWILALFLPPLFTPPPARLLPPLTLLLLLFWFLPLFRTPLCLVLTFRDVECVQALTFGPHEWKREGVLFLLSSGSYSIERHRVPSLLIPRFCQYTELFFQR